MNFLAHIYLSGENEDILLGNFIADMVKGRQIDNFHQGIVDGIMLHRKIDTFTDTHPIVDQSKNRLRNKYRLYAGVVVDMFYDHYLAKNWSDYSRYSLTRFVKEAYHVLLKNYFLLPVRAKNMLPYMVSSNWLVNYASLDSMEQLFEGMARRTPFKSGMENAVDDLRLYYGDFENEFRTFFPELVDYVAKQGISHQHHYNGR
ncbi:MAG: ACP phosphodiesterase [Bacteroides sp.]|jgi:acyl carrier protein phosphodiesterase|nr:ACP phosphodiesterase [Bacteroides sp.]